MRVEPDLAVAVTTRALHLERLSCSTGEPEVPAHNPDVNTGTGSLDRKRWAPLVDRLIAELRRFDFPTGPRDVRENVTFFGGRFPQWVHEIFPETACSISIEVTKIFMDEWTGEPFPGLIDAVQRALDSAMRRALEELRKL